MSASAQTCAPLRGLFRTAYPLRDGRTVIVREAVEEDAALLALVLREADRREVFLSGSHSARDQIRNLITDTAGVARIAVHKDGTPIAAWGVTMVAAWPTVWIAWCVTTIAANGISERDFMRYSKEWFGELVADRARVEAHVDQQYNEAYRWLRWLGFEREDSCRVERDGIEGHLLRMVWTREDF